MLLFLLQDTGGEFTSSQHCAFAELHATGLTQLLERTTCPILTKSPNAYAA